MQPPSVFISPSRRQRQIPSVRAPFILALASTPYICTVHTVLAYMAMQGDRPGPLFLCQNGQPISHSMLTNWLRQIRASSPSFCIGAATVAAHNGIPDHLIQELGQWKSNAHQCYIRTLSEALASRSSHDWLLPAQLVLLAYCQLSAHAFAFRLGSELKSF